jgi:hypothetical protein
MAQRQTWRPYAWEQQSCKQEWSQMVHGKMHLVTLFGHLVRDVTYASIVHLHSQRENLNKEVGVCHKALCMDLVLLETFVLTVGTWVSFNTLIH